MTDDRAITGRCACGAVRFRLAGPMRPVVACHCRTCRRQSGHVAAATQVCVSGFGITAGMDRVRWWSATPDARRGFCDTCGSLLFWEPAKGGRMSVFAGALDAPTGLRLDRHIHAQEKGDYYEIADGLPAFEGRG